jgi:N-acyl-D-aspartate/D-glutamate deacylase
MKYIPYQLLTATMHVLKNLRGRGARSVLVFRLLIIIGVLCSAAPPLAQSQSYDVLIRNGRLLDGTGNPWYRADVAIRDDRIAAVGDLSGATADREVDAEGLYVAPGFIDTHSHAGSALATPDLSHARPLLAQGITTVTVNPDGGGAVDLTAQREGLLADGLGVNVAQLVPHGSVREAVLGMADRAPTREELEAMKTLVRRGMEAGAFGLSSGPFYAPGSFSETDELIALSRVAAAHGGVYQSHIRDESNYSIGVVAAVEEVIEIAREAGLPGIITHVKALGPPVWGYSAAIERRVERARAAGVEVFADQYPYNASATSLKAALVPRWAEAGGRDSLRARMEAPTTRTRLVMGMEENLARRGGAGRIQFRRYESDSSIEGQTLADVADARGEGAIETALALLADGSPGIVSFNMADEDVHRFMRQPWTMTSSDGGLGPMGEGVPHPRNYGAFPRKVRKFAVEEGVVELGFAIRSMTALPAAVFQMDGRGLLREGAAADVVVFDLERLRDPATFQAPHQLAEGMVHVLVNGTFAIEDEQFTEQMSGQVLAK